MARPIPTDAYESVLEAIARFPDGARIEQIEENLDAPPNRRTLQRWLNNLITQERVRREGQGRAVKYLRGKVVSATAQATVKMTATAHAEILIPLSPEAKEVEILVRKPLMLRKPIGYNRAFLDDYRPNDTYYLTQEIRDELLSQGQAISSNEPAGTYARQLAHRLLIDLSWNSSRLEGNTYSLLETERLISAGEAATGKDALESQMILNHKEAIEFLIDSAGEIGFNRYTLLNLHALLSDNLLDDPTASGRLRTIAVGIGQTTFLPLEGPQRIEECFDQVLDTAAAIRDPFEQAFFAMVHLPYLQPFEDVNKRVARLAANIPLIQRNLCPLSFVDVSQSTYISAMLGIYELNRIELLCDVFVWAYKRSCARYSAVRQSLGYPDPFRLRYRQYIIQAVADVVREKLSKTQAVSHIQRFAQEQIEAPDRERFIEVVETQLLSLHEGNIARYRLRPSEFHSWRGIWK
ncbi:Fic family protein [Sedimenticola hydrogenitrophicus]|uniref:Fic family protein n=1 Tax=Sedimenticola hydrogenitrophicus TaxID=2967975 RepID=UPI0021A3CCEA|nr:Fic family protein [Sedimenticola hydrogenitrophicus]